jgi:hypothetical protein
MKNLILNLTLIFLGLTSYSQNKVENKNESNTKMVNMTKMDQKMFLQKNEVKLLITDAEKKGYSISKSFNSESKTFIISDKSTKSSISVFVYTMINKAKETIDIVQFSDNDNKTINIWAETEKTITTIENGKLSVKEQATANKSQKSLSSCFQQYARAGVTSCNTCINCVNSCWSRNKKWQRITCALTNCSSSCWSCVTNVFNFIRCIFN